MKTILIVVNTKDDIKDVVDKIKVLMFNVTRAVTAPVGVVECPMWEVKVVPKEIFSAATRGQKLDAVINLANLTKEEVEDVKTMLFPCFL